MKAVDAYLFESLGPDVYTLAVTAYSGEDAMVGMALRPVAPASEGSLEARLHGLRLTTFADLRPLSAQPEVLSGLIMRLRDYDADVVPHLRRVVDGMPFLDEMRPATPLVQGSDSPPQFVQPLFGLRPIARVNAIVKSDVAEKTRAP